MNANRYNGKSSHPASSKLFPLIDILQETVDKQVPVTVAYPCPHVPQLILRGSVVQPKIWGETSREYKVHQLREDGWQHVSIFEKILEKEKKVSFEKYTSIWQTETLNGKLTRSILVEPIEQLLSKDIPTGMRQQVDPTVLETQMPQQGLHDAGLLKYGIVMWSWFVTEAKT